MLKYVKHRVISGGKVLLNGRRLFGWPVARVCNQQHYDSCASTADAVTTALVPSQNALGYSVRIISRSLSQIRLQSRGRHKIGSPDRWGIEREREYERETCFMFHEIASTPGRVAVPCRAYSVFIMNDVGLLTRMKVQTRWKLAWDGNKLGHRISRYFLRY